MRARHGGHRRAVAMDERAGMSAMDTGASRLMGAFVGTARCFAGLTVHDDLHEHVSGLLVGRFGASWAAFAVREASGNVRLAHVSPDGVVDLAALSSAGVMAAVSGVLDSGSPTTCVVPCPHASMTAFLPVGDSRGSTEVLLVGHRTADPLAREVLDVYLAIAGLAGATRERLHDQLDLVRHRARLEDQVRKRTAELEEALRRTDLILRSIHEGICGLDADGRVAFVNPWAEATLGWRGDDLVGRDAHETFHRPHRAESGPDDCPVLKTLADGVGRFVADEEFVRRDGTRFPVEMTVAPMKEGARTVGAVLAFRDVSQRRKVERALADLRESLERRVAERTAEVEAKSARLRQLAIQLSEAEQKERARLAKLLHDHLQQFLVAARVQADVIERRAAGTALVAAAAELGGLLEDAIRASRLLTAELSPLILQDGGLVPAIDWLARWFFEKHGLTVGVDADPLAEPEDIGVRVTLFECVRELLLNVARFAGVDRAAVRVSCRQGCIRIDVEDRGRGFDPAGRTADGAGRGFGLFAISERVENLQGRLSVDSEPGRGTLVVLEVPARLRARSGSGEGGSLPAAAAGPVGTGPIRVVLVDDHAILREGLATLLAAEPDIRVVGQAGDGLAALDAACRLHPDVVVMDVSMPVMDGVEATRRIRAEVPGVRVIGLSLHDSDEMENAMLKAGASAYVTKGGAADVLIARIREVALARAAAGGTTGTAGR